MNSSTVPLSSIVHPRRMFSVYDKMGEYIRTWKRNRESEAAYGLFTTGRTALPIPYTRNTPTPKVEIGTDSANLAFTCMLEERQMLSYFPAFWSESRQIFSFDTDLTDALRKTDVANVPWGEVLLPHKEFYLSFPSPLNPRFTLDGIEYIADGAYVLDATGTPQMEGRVLALRVTAHPLSISTEDLISQDKRLEAMPMIICLMGASETATVGVALQNGASHMAKDAAYWDENMASQMIRLQREAGADSPQTTPSTHYRSRHAQTAPVIDEILPLVINAIFYLCQRPEDTTSGFEPDAPKAIIDQIEDPKLSHKKKRLAEGHLGGLGFSRIQFVANRDIKTAADSVPTGGTTSVHWRRGHWHRFAHGPGRTLRKWLFVAPVLVNGSRGEMAQGTEHQVKSRTLDSI